MTPYQIAGIIVNIILGLLGIALCVWCIILAANFDKVNSKLISRHYDQKIDALDNKDDSKYTEVDISIDNEWDTKYKEEDD